MSEQKGVVIPQDAPYVNALLLQAMRGIVKWADRADTPAEAPGKLRDAFRAMLAGRHQPAVFEMAPDVMGRSEEVALLDPERFNEGPETDEKTIEAAAKLLGAAEKPVIFVGSGPPLPWVTE